MSDLQKLFRDNYNGNENSLQACILLLKEKGYSQIETIKFLMDELGLSLKDADQKVLHSSAWVKEKSTTMKLREDLDKEISGE